VDCRLQLPEGVVAPGQLILEEKGEQRIVELRLPPDQVDAALDYTRKAGGSVLSVIPHQKSLEQVLLDEVERAKPANTKHLGVLA
jgi:hypothetical protein